MRSSISPSLVTGYPEDRSWCTDVSPSQSTLPPDRTHKLGPPTIRHWAGCWLLLREWLWLGTNAYHRSTPREHAPAAKRDREQTAADDKNRFHRGSRSGTSEKLQFHPANNGSIARPAAPNLKGSNGDTNRSSSVAGAARKGTSDRGNVQLPTYGHKIKTKRNGPKTRIEAVARNRIHRSKGRPENRDDSRQGQTRSPTGKEAGGDGQPQEGRTKSGIHRAIGSFSELEQADLNDSPTVAPR